MGKYMKIIESNEITDVHTNEQRNLMNHYKDQPNNGPTIYAFKNPETNISRVAFVDKSYLYEYDEETDFTWRFGYKDGHPGIYITLHAISDTLKYNEGAVICLETNSCNGGKNEAIGIWIGDSEGNAYINYDLENITWKNINNITLNEEFFIYICGNRSIRLWRWISRRKIIKNEGKLPDDWTMTINIRPTIRFQGNPGSIYTNYKALAKYQEVTYLYNTEYGK
jgi:hypothetical protein